MPVKEPTELTKAFREVYLKYRYLRAPFVIPLLSMPCGKEYLKYKHRTLVKAGVLFKPPEQREFENCRYVHNVHTMLKSARIPEDDLVLPVTRLYRRKPSKNDGEFNEQDVKVKNYDHAMMICDTLASIEIE